MELAIEVGEVVVADLHADPDNGQVGFCEQTAGALDAPVVEVGHEACAGYFPEKPGERRDAHVHMPGDFPEGNPAFAVVVYEREIGRAHV